MADILRIKRRAVGGAAGPPATLNAAELAYNEQDDTLYYGKGNSSGVATSIVPVAGSGAFQNNVGRNLLHNPYFNVQQRGAGNFTANAAYTADRWRIGVAGDTVSFGLLQPGVQAGLDETAAYVLRNTFTGTAGATAYNQISQAVEKVIRLSNQTVTLSFMALASSAGLKLGANLYQYFGSGGSPAAGGYIQATGASFTLTAGWARYSATFTVPSIGGKTLGTNGDDFTQVVLAYSSGASGNAVLGNVGVQSGTVYIWGIQLEIGSTATPLEKIDPGEDLRRCQRFFMQSPMSLNIAFNSWAASSYQLLPVYFPVAMRAAPTVTLGSSSGLANVSSLASSGPNPYGFYLNAFASAAGGATASIAGFSASADL